MRISEIKKCFDDYKIVVCVKAFWEDEIFREALVKDKSSPTPEKVYDIIRDVFLQMLNNSQAAEEKRKIRNYRKALRKISKQMYDDPNHWTIGTEWEKIYADREKRRQKWEEAIERVDVLSSLYDRLHLLRIEKKRDILFQISRYDDFYQAVIIRDSSDSPIAKIEDLYDCLEEVILNALQDGEWEIGFFFLSFL